MRVFALSAPETRVNSASHGLIDVVVGRTVIFSSRARGTAPHRAFFMMGASVDKWISCELPTGGLGQNQVELRSALCSLSPIGGEGRSSSRDARLWRRGEG
jgi:hypothetical protein